MALVVIIIRVAPSRSGGYLPGRAVIVACVMPSSAFAAGARQERQDRLATVIPCRPSIQPFAGGMRRCCAATIWCLAALELLS